MTLIQKMPGDVFDIKVPGFRYGEPILRVSMIDFTVTRLSTGEEINFATDADGYCNRPGFVMVPSETDAKKEYMVSKIDPSDPRTWLCTCPDFVNRRAHQNRSCKHIGYAFGIGYERFGE